MTETPEMWGWFIDIEKEYEKKYKKQVINTLLHNIPETIYEDEEKEYYYKNTFPCDTYFIKQPEQNLFKIIDPITLVLLSLFVSVYILIVI